MYQIPTTEALTIWPIECQNEVKLKVLEKYRWFYERLLEVEALLSDKPYRAGSIQIDPAPYAIENARSLEIAKQVENHTTKNYP